MYDNLTRTNLEFAYQKAEKRIEDLEQDLKHEQDLNAEIKARFVKCNTCTPDMKEKCLMFNENLCEGERCEELVDLMSLVNKRDTDDKLDKAKEILAKLLEEEKSNMYWEMNGSDKSSYYEVRKQAEQFLKEIEK